MGQDSWRLLLLIPYFLFVIPIPRTQDKLWDSLLNFYGDRNGDRLAGRSYKAFVRRTGFEIQASFGDNRLNILNILNKYYILQYIQL